MCAEYFYFKMNLIFQSGGNICCRYHKIENLIFKGEIRKTVGNDNVTFVCPLSSVIVDVLVTTTMEGHLKRNGV